MAVPRTIHSATTHAMGPGMRWLASVVRRCLGQYSHILRDSDHFLDRVRDLSVECGDKLLFIHVKYFFFSGHHEGHIQAAQAHVQADLKNALLRCCVWCLEISLVA